MRDEGFAATDPAKLYGTANSSVSPGRGIQVCEVFCLYSSKQARIQAHGNTAAQVRKLPRRSIAAQARKCPAKCCLSG